MFFIFFGYFRAKADRLQNGREGNTQFPGRHWIWHGSQQRQSLLAHYGASKPFVTFRRLATLQSEKSETEFRRSFGRFHQ